MLANKELSDVVTALGCGFAKSFDLAKLRYDRVIILADADSDGHHIATLLLTFFYRYLPGLVTSGKVFLAQPPLYRVDIGKETHWAVDDAHRDRLVAPGPGRPTGAAPKPQITRFKGLGEMMPKRALGDDAQPRYPAPAARRDRVDPLKTDRVIADLMGRDASARFRFIMERADDALDLDV